MRNLIAFLCISFCVATSHAQAPYAGGKGDGYAHVALRGATVSLDEMPGRDSGRWYPQPAAAGQPVFLTTDRPSASPIRFEVFDVQGRLCKEGQLQEGQLLPTQGLSPGVYRVTVTSRAWRRDDKLLLR